MSMVRLRQIASNLRECRASLEVKSAEYSKQVARIGDMGAVPSDVRSLSLGLRYLDDEIHALKMEAAKIVEEEL